MCLISVYACRVRGHTAEYGLTKSAGAARGNTGGQQDCRAGAPACAAPTPAGDPRYTHARARCPAPGSAHCSGVLPPYGPFRAAVSCAGSVRLGVARTKGPSVCGVPHAVLAALAACPCLMHPAAGFALRFGAAREPAGDERGQGNGLAAALRAPAPGITSHAPLPVCPLRPYAVRLLSVATSVRHTGDVRPHMAVRVRAVREAKMERGSCVRMASRSAMGGHQSQTRNLDAAFHLRKQVAEGLRWPSAARTLCVCLACIIV